MRHTEKDSSNKKQTNKNQITNKQSISDLWDNYKWPNIRVDEMSEERREWGTEKYLKK